MYWAFASDISKQITSSSVNIMQNGVIALEGKGRELKPPGREENI